MTGRQQKAIAALIRAPTRAEAAKEAGVGVSTLRRWLKEDTEFKNAYREAVSEILEGATRKAQTAAGEAVDVLRDIMKNTGEQAAPRVSAADKVLGYALKLGEQLDLAQRMDEIERAIADMEGGENT